MKRRSLRESPNGARDVWPYSRASTMTATALAAFATCDMIGAPALFLVIGSSTPTPGATSASAPPPLS
jgi:hypothetical protein